MAIMHCQVKNIGRSSGRSAVASSAYRSGEKLEDKETGLQHDYTKKSGIEYTEIILCKNAPEEYKDRSTLWNEVQKIEKSKDARLAREWEVAIPKELSKEQGQKLVHDFGQSLAKDGMCVDIAIHDKGDGNRHAHIMGTTRPIQENGEWGNKEKKAYSLDQSGQKIPILDENGEQKIGAKGRKMWQRETVESNDWNKTEKVEEWRERWASECNKYLSQEQQIDHRSNERQGKEEIPTIHEGFVARDIEQKGGVSELCQTNRDIKEYNNLNHELSRLGALRQVLLQQLENIKEKAKEALNERLQRFRTTRTTNEPSGRNADGSRPTESRSAEERLASLPSSGQSRGTEQTIGELLRSARADLSGTRVEERDSEKERDNKVSQRENRDESRERQRADAERRAEQAKQLAEARKAQYRKSMQRGGPEI